jgi:hypothetical protein
MRRTQRVLALAMERCAFWQQGALRLIAASTHGEVSRQSLLPLKRTASRMARGWGRGQWPPQPRGCIPHGTVTQ